MIPTYNPGHYLRETIESVLSQDPGPDVMEIEVIDNCSTKDDVKSMVEEIGRGRVGFHQQETNIGPIPNSNSCIQRSRGEWVHVLHADDIVRPGFYKRVQNIIRDNKDIGAIAFRIMYIDESSLWIGLSDLEARQPRLLGKDFAMRQLTAQRFQFVGMIVRRSLYENIGAFRTDLAHAADWEMWNRVVLRSAVFYEPDPLACYRIHQGSDSASLFKTGENVEDERRAIRVSCSYLPADQYKGIYREAMRQAAIRATRRMRKYFTEGDYKAAFAQMIQAFRCNAAPLMIARVVCTIGLAFVERP
jgi:glycosyltransferase involved in cell wall biosynthesis